MALRFSRFRGFLGYAVFCCFEFSVSLLVFVAFGVCEIFRVSSVYGLATRSWRCCRRPPPMTAACPRSRVHPSYFGYMVLYGWTGVAVIDEVCCGLLRFCGFFRIFGLVAYVVLCSHHRKTGTAGLAKTGTAGLAWLGFGTLCFALVRWGSIRLGWFDLDSYCLVSLWSASVKACLPMPPPPPPPIPVPVPLPLPLSLPLPLPPSLLLTLACISAITAGYWSGLVQIVTYLWFFAELTQVAIHERE